MLRGTLPFGTLWAEGRWELGPELALEPGLRVEVGPSVWNGGAVRLMPRLTTRWAPTPDLSFSAGAGRTYQYAQALAATGPSVVGGYTASHLWLLADKEVPAIRADVGTLGAELWIGGSWLLAANGYVRRSTGVTLPDPTAGSLVDRPLFVTGESRARGLELSARRLAGRLTASASYALGVAETTAAGLTFPTSEDRRHAIDLTSMVRVRGALRAGAAFTYATGTPYTRIHIRNLPCTPAMCGYDLVADAKNAQRGPAYSSLDLLLDWTKRMRSWDLGLFVQVRNALGHRNAVTFIHSAEYCVPSFPNDPACVRDQFENGLPTLPVFGVRARF
jgi:hypothetical protein